MIRSKIGRVTVAACLVLTVAAMAYVVGQASPPAAKVMRAERFELVDSTAKVTAVLAASPDGLGVCDQSGKMRAIVGMPLDGVPALGLLDETGQTRISLSMTSDGASELSMSKKNGKATLHLIVSPDGTAGLYLNGTDGRGRAAMYVSADDCGKLAVYDKARRAVWQAP